MAIALYPEMRRRYDPNPKGSATAQVMMASDNPFERRVSLVNSGRSMMPGMGALGAEAAAAPVPATGVDWTAIATGALQAGTQVGQTALTNAVNRVLPPPKPVTLSAPQATYMPVVNPVVAPAKPSIMPWVIGGGVAVLGLGALFLVMRKKR
jgi:hypothetical protein